LGALGALASLPAGCERKAPDNAPKTASAPPPASAAPQQSATDSKAEMVAIPAGRFVMGDKDQADAPPHEVTVSAFYMDKYPVKQDRYQAVMGGNPSRWKGANNPVEQVRWSDAVRYCNKRSQLEGLEPCYDLRAWKCNFDANGYRLPTEAEWEYACRAGSATAYFFGDTPSKLGDYAWYDKNSGGHPRPVGQKQPNRWGLFDICGNVWNGATTFTRWTITRRPHGKTPKDPRRERTRCCAVGPGGSVSRAAARATGITRIRGTRMSVSDMTFTVFDARGRRPVAELTLEKGV